MNRKKFLATGALAALSVSVFGKVTKSKKGYVGNCTTSDDILGPYYRPKAPTRSDLTYEGLEGSIIELKGQVFQEDCTTPIQNALVEIWHCDTLGAYDNDSDEFRCRAKLFTDKDGNYAFKTILPGKYLNGKLYRPAHIHFRVTAKNSQELISQIYFHGDPHIEEDHWASQEKAIQRILPIQLEDVNGNLAVNFDIVLGDK